MEPLLDFVGQYWWLAFVFGGSIAGGARALGAANQRRAERRQERFRIKHEAKVEIARARAFPVCQGELSPPLLCNSR